MAKIHPAVAQHAMEENERLRGLLDRVVREAGVELVPFWVLFDATTPEPLIKKHMPEGVLAFFDNEEDARRAKALHPGTDYKRAPYVRAAALSAVTAERDRLADMMSGEVETNVELREQCHQLRAEVEALRKDAERWRYVSLQGDDMHWLNLLRVDLDDFGGNINAAVDALIDGEAPAMAAKEA